MMWRSNAERKMFDIERGKAVLQYRDALRPVAQRQPFSSFEARIIRGLDPVQRLKARENAPGSENPTK